MNQQTTSYPLRLLASIALSGFVIVAVLLGVFLTSSMDDSSELPSMSKPSVFYQIGSMFDLHAERDRKLSRDLWQGGYEMDAIGADPELSAWASGSYAVAGPGVVPDAVGKKLSDQELSLFRRELEVRLGDDWQYAPVEIRRKYERLLDTQSMKGLTR